MTAVRMGMLPWDNTHWFKDASAWIHTQLTGQGMQITQEVEILHQRAWSTFARVTTDRGVAYFKASSPYDRFEAALTAAMWRWRPDITAPVLAIEPEEGWLLTSDAGITMREFERSPAQVGHWLKILPRYADLQMQMLEKIPELLQMGLPDRRLAALPNLFNQLTESANLRTGQNPGLTHEEYRQLQEIKPRFAAECAHLASYNIPETLTHEEVTEVNLLVRGDRYILTDWSEASICHPFFSMLTTVRTLIFWTGLDENGPELARLLDAYLEPWTRYETRSKINSAYQLAFRLAMANRAISWDQGTGSLAPKHKEPYADAVPGWLRDYLTADGR